MKIEDFIKENIPDDVIWKGKITDLVQRAYNLGTRNGFKIGVDTTLEKVDYLTLEDFE